MLRIFKQNLVYTRNKRPQRDWARPDFLCLSVSCGAVENLKNDRMISVHFQGKPFNITVIQVYAPTSNAEEADVERFYEDLQDLLELIPKKMSFSL